MHEALFDTPDDAVVVENAFGRVSGRDIHRLRKGDWLNDEVINYYLLMIRERSMNPGTFINSKKPHSKGPTKKLPRIHAFNTFFYALLSERGYQGVRRWTKKAKVNLFDLDKVVIPVNRGNQHWVLCVVNVSQKRIEYYDSMGNAGVSNQNRSVLETVKRFMIEEAKAYNRSPADVEQWTFYVPVLTFELQC